MAEEGGEDEEGMGGEISQRGKWLNGFLQGGRWSALHNVDVSPRVGTYEEAAFL